MFDNILSIFTGVEVSTLPNGNIRILGLKTEPFLLAISRLWNTSKIGMHFFKTVKSRQLDIYPFFAPDLLYICKRLISERRVRVNRKDVTELIHQLQTNTWMRSTASEGYVSKLNYSALDRFTWAPKPHQMDFLKIYDENSTRWCLNGYILAAAPGSGKTFAALMISECLDTDITICIVPKPVVEKVWKDTLEEVFKKPVDFWYSTSDKPLVPGMRYYVAHYEQIGRMLEFAKQGHFKNKKVNIVLDESHNLNEIKSQRTLLLAELSRYVNSVSTLWTSGTPLKAMGSEVIPILRTIDPFFNDAAEEAFKKVFGISTARGLDILAHRLGFMTFKVEKSIVVGNKVDYYRVDVSIDNGNDYTLKAISADMTAFIKERVHYYDVNKAKYLKQYKDGLRAYERNLRTSIEIREFNEYVRMADLLHFHYDPMMHKQEPILCNAYEKKLIIPNLPKDLREDFKNSRSVYKYVSLKIQGEALGRILSKKREQCNVDMLNAINDFKCTDIQTKEKFSTSLNDIIESTPAKTLVFTSYVAVVDKLYDMYKAAGAFPLKVYGDTNSELPQIVSQFEKDQRTNPLVATMKSLGTGVPMIMCSAVVFMNSPFRDYEREQAISRLDRLGQTNTVEVYEVFLDTGAEPNISTRSADIMEWSRSQVAAMMGMPVLDGVALEGYVDVFDSVEANLPEAGVKETGKIDSLSPAGTTGQYVW